MCPYDTIVVQHVREVPHDTRDIELTLSLDVEVVIPQDLHGQLQDGQEDGVADDGQTAHLKREWEDERNIFLFRNTLLNSNVDSKC